MRQNYSIGTSGAQLVNDSLAGYPGGVTVINTGTATAYLGEDSSVDTGNGTPLTAGMSTRWSQPMLYAAAASPTTLQLTDAATTPLSANLPVPTPSDAWTWGAALVSGGLVTGVSNNPQLPATSAAQCAFTASVGSVVGNAYTTFTVYLISTFSGAQTSLGAKSVYANSSASVIFTGISIPWGGYKLGLVAGYSANLVSASATLVRPS